MKREIELATPMDRAIAKVRLGKMTRVQAAKKYKVSVRNLNTFCNALGIKSTLGRPKKK